MHDTNTMTNLFPAVKLSSVDLLRNLWTLQGVPESRQAEILAEIYRKAQPGAMVGPFKLIEKTPEPSTTKPALIHYSRDEAIAEIKRALQNRSGKAWSVTGGRGTAWGWITIDAPPKRRTWHAVLKDGANDNRPENYEMKDTGKPGGCMSPAEQAELGQLLGLGKPVHHQGEGIAASSRHYMEYVDRANGRKPTICGEQYWD